METVIVISKVKKFIKDSQGLNTSASFFEPLNQDVINSVNKAADHAKVMGRKTVMGKDFDLYKEGVEVKEALVVASKIKKYIKENFGLNTSSQAIEQLTLRVQQSSLNSIQNAIKEKRKTVMDRDFSAPENSSSSGNEYADKV